MALLFLRDESVPALWSLCGLVLEDGARPGDVREACAELSAELLACGSLPDAARREREASGRAIRSARVSTAPTLPPRPRWGLAGRRRALLRPLGVAVAVAGGAESAAALVGGAVAALTVAGLVALGGCAAVWVAMMLDAREAG